MKTVLFVNHQQSKCGVYQYGFNTAANLAYSEKYKFVYLGCDRPGQLDANLSEIPDVCAIIYNYHVSTLGWANSNYIERVRQRYPHIKHLMIHHEPHQPLPESIDAVISQNPSDPWVDNRYSVARILHPYHGPVPKNPVPTIGTFGFGLSGKGYDRLVQMVCEEFDEAKIRMHIPFAYYGDERGTLARGWADRARAALTKESVTLVIDHDWFSVQDLLFFLACNDLNVFLYDNMDRGIAGTLDFAMSVPRPFAITSCLMFKHVWERVPEVLIETSSLKEIMSNGTAPWEHLKEEWSPLNLIKNYEDIITEVCS